MNLESLKKMRSYVPGVILVLMIKLYKTNSMSELGEYFDFIQGMSIESVSKLLIVIVLGYFYNVFKLRRILFEPYLLKVQQNIKSRILHIVNKRHPVSCADTIKFLESNRGMNIFYKIVDSDKSLENKSLIIKHNGLMWSSLTDTCIFSVFFAGLEFGKLLYLKDIYYAYVVCIFLCLAVVSMIFNILAVKNHIKLSNEQLDMMEQLHSEKICNEFLK